MSTYRDAIAYTEAKGIIGFIRFLQGYYMLIFKEAVPIAKLGCKIVQYYCSKEHKIFEIDKTHSFPLFE
jgi:hypothetical protein